MIPRVRCVHHCNGIQNAILLSILVDDQQSSILFRQGGMGARPGVGHGFDEIENSRRIATNFLFGNTTSPYDFGLMTQVGMEQSLDTTTGSNNNFTFIQANQRTKYDD